MSFQSQSEVSQHHIPSVLPTVYPRWHAHKPSSSPHNTCGLDEQTPMTLQYPRQGKQQVHRSTTRTHCSSWIRGPAVRLEPPSQHPDISFPRRMSKLDTSIPTPVKSAFSLNRGLTFLETQPFFSSGLWLLWLSEDTMWRHKSSKSSWNYKSWGDKNMVSK